MNSFRPRWSALLGTGGICLGAIVLLIIVTVPQYRRAAEWRLENWRAAVWDLWIGRADNVPVPADAPFRATPAGAAPTVAASYEERAQPPTAAALAPTASPQPPTPIPLPQHANLTGTRYEKQDINNCGPATMAMMLSYWGWKGNQSFIQQILRPNRRDKNVRWDEMVYYVKNYAGWLDALFRAGGNVEA